MKRTVFEAVVFLATGFFATGFLAAGLAEVADFLAAVALASPAGRLAAGLAWSKTEQKLINIHLWNESFSI